MRAMIPAAIIDFESTMRKAKVKPDAAAAFFHLLFLTGKRMKKNPNYAPGVPRKSRWRPTNAEVFKVIAGANYKKVIQAMVNAEWIEVRKSVRTGKAAFNPKNNLTIMYRIHPRLTSEDETKEILRVHTITDVYIRKGIIRQLKLSEKKLVELIQKKKEFVMPVHKKILQYADEFLINEEMMLQDMNAGKIDFKAKKNKNKTIDDLIGEAISFNQQDSKWATVDSFGKRLHFPLGNMDKLLRPYLYFKKRPNKPLALLDIKNSQPYFLALLMVKPELISFHVPEFIGLIPELEKRAARTDVKAFYIDCCTGMLYQKIAGECDLTGELKASIKDELFKNVFYGRPRNPQRLQPKEMQSDAHTPTDEDLAKVKANIKFKMLYPSVWENLYYLKKRKRNEFPFFSKIKTNNKKGGRMFTLLNCLAQRWESSQIFEIAKRAFDKNIKVVTIHDAFLIEDRHRAQMLAIIDDLFAKELQVHPPKVKPEPLNSVRQ